MCSTSTSSLDSFSFNLKETVEREEKDANRDRKESKVNIMSGDPCSSATIQNAQAANTMNEESGSEERKGRRESEPVSILASAKHPMLDPRRKSVTHPIPQIMITYPSPHDTEESSGTEDRKKKRQDLLSPKYFKSWKKEVRFVSKCQSNGDLGPCEECRTELSELKSVYQTLQTKKEKMHLLGCVYDSLIPEESALAAEFECSEDLVKQAVTGRRDYRNRSRGFYNTSKIARFDEEKNLWVKDVKPHLHYKDLCTLHENLQFMIQPLIPKFFTKDGILEEVLETIICNRQDPLCMFGLCDECPYPENVNYWKSNIEEDDDIEYFFWQEVDGEKDKMYLTFIREPQPKFSQTLNSLFTKQFSKHCFIREKQNQFLKELNKEMKFDKSIALVKTDFCEPYMPFRKVMEGLSKHTYESVGKEITVHPFMIEYFEEVSKMIETRFFVVISNDLRRTSSTAFLFRHEMVRWVKKACPNVQNIAYFTDDNPSHYKNAGTILNLLYHMEDFKLRASHEFTVEGHDTWECSYQANEIKNLCRSATLRGETDITNSLEMFAYCKRKLSGWHLDFGYVDRDDFQIRRIEGKLVKRYRLNRGVIPGLNHFNSFQPIWDYDGGWNEYVRVKRFHTSQHERIIKVRVVAGHVGPQSDDQPPFLLHYDPKEVMIGKHTLDQNKLRMGNLVTFEIEGIKFIGKISNDGQIQHGYLQTALLSRLEMKGRGRKEKLKSKNFKLEKEVWITTLDVVNVEECGDEKGKNWESGRRRTLACIFSRGKSRDGAAAEEKSHDIAEEETESPKAVPTRRRSSIRVALDGVLNFLRRKSAI